MAKIIKNFLILLFCLFSIFSFKVSRNDYTKMDFTVFSDFSHSIPSYYSFHPVKNHIFYNYIKFNVSDLIKIEIITVIYFYILLCIPFLTYVNLIGHYNINFQKKKNILLNI
jgi:hypothetical protein